MKSNFKKHLRQNSTNPERILWYQLRNRYFTGIKFRRQHQIKNFIVDFVCLEKNLIVELDGGQHAMKVEYDLKRTRELENGGFRVLRFWNNEVLVNLNGVLQVIDEVLRGVR